MKRQLTPSKEDMDVVHRPHKKLDLRNFSYNCRFSCKKFEFVLSHGKENITTHSTDEENVPDYAIIHFYLHCSGMDEDFIFSGSGPNRRTLKQLLHGEHLDIIIDRFAQMIQSGRDVTLDNETRLRIYAFIPPAEYR